MSLLCAHCVSRGSCRARGYVARHNRAHQRNYTFVPDTMADSNSPQKRYEMTSTGSRTAWDAQQAATQASDDAPLAGPVPVAQPDTSFLKILGAHFTVVVLCIALLLKAPNTAGEAPGVAGAAPDNQVGRYYMFYSHVTIMIVVGFGFLMTFLKRHGYSSVSFNFMLAGMVFLWNMFCATWWENVEAGDITHRPAISLPLMVEGMFGTGAVLISFGVVLGKTTPSQLVIIAFWEIIFYSANFMIGALMLHATDAGGTMFIHTFGAYFGVALAFFLSPKGAGKVDHPYNGSSYNSDLFSMIGTTFLWIYWPSFNGALAGDGHQLAAVVNTHLSLAGSILAAFWLTFYLSSRHVPLSKFDMVHIQNATLAGGVAMGSCANMAISPWLCVLIGAGGGALSTLGYHAVTDKLRAKFNIDDTCGAHNLHGLPGIYGAVLSAIVVLTLDDADATGIVYENRSKGEQAAFQLIVLGITIGMAVVGAAITAKIAQFLAPSVEWPHAAFVDHPTFLTPDDYPSVGEASPPYGGKTPEQVAASHMSAAGLTLAPPPSASNTPAP